MNYHNYILQSLHVFVLSFIIGVTIDNTFAKLVNTYKDNILLLAIIQLFVIITVSYILNTYHFYYIETYTPHILFSSFLLSLQTTMISIFRTKLITNH